MRFDEILCKLSSNSREKQSCLLQNKKRQAYKLFKLRCSFLCSLCIASEAEEDINIRFDGVDLLCLPLETCSFIIESLLLLSKPFLLGLE